MVVIGLGMRLPRELKLTDGARSEASKKTSMMSFRSTPVDWNGR